MCALLCRSIAFAGFLFILGASSSGQDLKTIGKDKDSLKKQSDQLDSVIKTLQDCVDESKFASKKDSCQRAKDFHLQQKAIVSEKMELLDLQSDPVLLSDQLKNEATLKMNQLDAQYAALTHPAVSRAQNAKSCKPDKDHPCLSQPQEWDYLLSGVVAGGKGKTGEASEVLIDGLNVPEPKGGGFFQGNPLIDETSGAFMVWLERPLQTGQRVRVRFLNEGAGNWSDEMIVKEREKSGKKTESKTQQADQPRLGTEENQEGVSASTDNKPPDQANPTDQQSGGGPENQESSKTSKAAEAKGAVEQAAAGESLQQVPDVDCPIPVSDCRGAFDASAYVGVGIDTFASSQVNSVLNPGATSAGPKERAVAGFDFEYRLLGKPNVNYSDSPEFRWNKQLWVYGETVHGVRSSDIDCTKNANFPTCQKSLPTGTTGAGQEFLFVLRNASSLEGFGGFRWEFATLQPRLVDSANLFVKAQAGFLAVSGRPGSAAALHHFGIGALATTGLFAGNYLEAGHGRNDLISQKRNGRWLVDAYLRRPIWRGVAGFAQVTVDTDLGKSADSVQSYLGLEFDMRRLFTKTTKAAATGASVAQK